MHGRFLQQTHSSLESSLAALPAGDPRGSSGVSVAKVLCSRECELAACLYCCSCYWSCEMITQQAQHHGVCVALDENRPGLPCLACPVLDLIWSVQRSGSATSQAVMLVSSAFSMWLEAAWLCLSLGPDWFGRATCNAWSRSFCVDRNALSNRYACALGILRTIERCHALTMHVRLQLVHSVSVRRRVSTIASQDAACRHAKLWKLPKTGNINNLTLVEHTLPAPSAGQVTVAVRAVRRRCSCPFHVYKLSGQALNTQHACRLASTLLMYSLVWGCTLLHQRRMSHPGWR